MFIANLNAKDYEVRRDFMCVNNILDRTSQDLYEQRAIESIKKEFKKNHDKLIITPSMRDNFCFYHNNPNLLIYKSSEEFELAKNKLFAQIYCECAK